MESYFWMSETFCYPNKKYEFCVYTRCWCYCIVTQPLQYDQTSFVISLFFLLTFFFILVISLFRNLLMFLSWTRVSRFSSKEFHSYTPCFIFCSLEQLLNWRRNLHEIIHIKRQGFLVGKTTVESISSAKFIAMYAWSHMHDGYLIDWIIHQNAPWRKHWKGALNWVQRLTHWHEFQVTCPYPVW